MLVGTVWEETGVTRRKPTCLTWWPHDHITPLSNTYSYTFKSNKCAIYISIPCSWTMIYSIHSQTWVRIIHAHVLQYMLSLLLLLSRSNCTNNHGHIIESPSPFYCCILHYVFTLSLTVCTLIRRTLREPLLPTKSLSLPSFNVQTMSSIPTNKDFKRQTDGRTNEHSMHNNLDREYKWYGSI